MEIVSETKFIEEMESKLALVLNEHGLDNSNTYDLEDLINLLEGHFLQIREQK